MTHLTLAAYGFHQEKLFRDSLFILLKLPQPATQQYFHYLHVHGTCSLNTENVHSEECLPCANQYIHETGKNPSNLSWYFTTSTSFHNRTLKSYCLSAFSTAFEAKSLFHKAISLFLFQAGTSRQVQHLFRSDFSVSLNFNPGPRFKKFNMKAVQLHETTVEYFPKSL